MAIGLRTGLRAAMAASVAIGCGVDQLGGSEKTLIVIAGQSNATTHDLTSNLSAANAGYTAVYPNVRMLSKQAVDTTLVFQTDGPSSLAPLVYDGGTKMGFELSLMRVLDSAQPGAFAMVRYAVGGSEAADWDTYKTAFSAYVLAAKATLGCSKIIVVWEQGEADARDLTKANNYLAWLGTFVTWLRTQFGATTPFVYGKLNIGVDIGFYIARTELRASQVSFDGSMSLVKMIDQDSITISADLAHYDANGYILVGNNFASQVATYAGVFIPPVAAFTHSEAARVATFTGTSAVYNTAIASYSWSMGGAGTYTSGSSTSASPVFTYSGDGTFGVTLTITDVRGRVSTYGPISVSVIGGIAGVTRDAGNGYYTPASAAEWNTFLADPSVGLGSKSAPTSLWLLQEASGNATDTIGGLTLTAANTPAYQQAVAGMIRKGVLCADGTAKAFSSVSASLPDISLTSALAVAIIQPPAAAPAVNRNVIALGVGANRSHLGLEASTGKARCTSGANIATGAASICDAAVRIVANRVNRGVLEDDAFVGPSVVLTPTAAAGMTGKAIEIGAQSGALGAAAVIYAYLVLFSAQDWSDAEVQTLIAKMGGG